LGGRIEQRAVAEKLATKVAQFGSSRPAQLRFGEVDLR
jgi:hypothetical protein